jgi:hypothetical protein
VFVRVVNGTFADIGSDQVRIVTTGQISGCQFRQDTLRDCFYTPLGVIFVFWTGRACCTERVVIVTATPTVSVLIKFSGVDIGYMWLQSYSSDTLAPHGCLLPIHMSMTSACWFAPRKWYLCKRATLLHSCSLHCENTRCWMPSNFGNPVYRVPFETRRP